MIHGSLVPINLSNVDKFAYRGKGRAWSLCAIDATLAAASYIVYIRVVNTYTRISTYKVRRRIKTRKLWNTKRGAVAGRVASTKSQYLGLKWRNWNLLLNHLSAAPFKLADLPLYIPLHQVLHHWRPEALPTPFSPWVQWQIPPWPGGHSLGQERLTLARPKLDVSPVVLVIGNYLTCGISCCD